MRRTGTVKWFNPAKGFGFITEEGGEPGDEIFVHYSQIQGDGFKTLKQHEKVEFDLDDHPHGAQAVNVVRLRGAGND